MESLISSFGLDWKLLIAQAVNFALLLAVLSYFLYKPLVRLIDERREKIAEGVEKAAAADRKLEEALEEGKRMVGDAAKEAEGVVAAARARAEEKGTEIVAGANAKATTILSDATLRAEEAKRQAIAESERDIARAAMLAAEKLLSKRG